MNKKALLRTNYFHRVFLGWLDGQIEHGRVDPERAIADMAPIDLRLNRDLFERFLQESGEGEAWRQVEAEVGPIDVLTYSNG